MKSCHKQPIRHLCLESHHRASHSSPGVDQYCTAPCWILRSWPAVFLFPLLLKFNCWVCRILWCEGSVMAPVTSFLPRLFYIWGYFRPWVWSIAGRYQMHQLLSCADHVEWLAVWTKGTLRSFLESGDSGWEALLLVAAHHTRHVKYIIIVSPLIELDWSYLGSGRYN